jgi:hypothetical protein
LSSLDVSLHIIIFTLYYYTPLFSDSMRLILKIINKPGGESSLYYDAFWTCFTISKPIIQGLAPWPRRLSLLVHTFAGLHVCAWPHAKQLLYTVKDKNTNNSVCRVFSSWRLDPTIMGTKYCNLKYLGVARTVMAPCVFFFNWNTFCRVYHSIIPVPSQELRHCRRCVLPQMFEARSGSKLRTHRWRHSVLVRPGTSFATVTQSLPCFFTAFFNICHVSLPLSSALCLRLLSRRDYVMSDHVVWQRLSELGLFWTAGLIVGTRGYWSK